MDRMKLIEVLKEAVARHKAKQKKWIDEFVSNPHYAMSWSDDMPFTSVVLSKGQWILDLVSRLEIEVTDPSPLSMEEVLTIARDEMLSLTKPCNSTSDGSRAVAKAELEFWGKLYKSLTTNISLYL